MLVSFIGSPCSGKTTCAAMLFADLKEHGNACEFLSEQARSYIAETRHRYQLLPTDPLVLRDSDQQRIMDRQLRLDTAFRSSVPPEVVVISDSSPLNALLYLSEAGRRVPEVKDMTARAVEQSDLVFYAKPVLKDFSFDAIRVHSREQSKEIDDSIGLVLGEYAPGIMSKIIRISGSPSARFSQAIRAVYNHMALA